MTASGALASIAAAPHDHDVGSHLDEHRNYDEQARRRDDDSRNGEIPSAGECRLTLSSEKACPSFSNNRQQASTIR